jgi:hypothetical protein
MRKLAEQDAERISKLCRDIERFAKNSPDGEITIRFVR